MDVARLASIYEHMRVDLLRELLYQAGRPIHAAQLIRIAWEREIRTEAQLRNYIGRLRGKLEMLDVPASIDSVRGRGYRLTTTTGSIDRV